MTATSGPGTVGLGIIGLVVRDVERSLDFYRLLGLDIPDDIDKNYYRLTLPTGQIFFWDSYEITRSYDPAWQPSSGDRRIVLEFGFNEPEQVDAKHDELVDAGYASHLTPRNVGAARYALMIDPDGNQVGLRHPAVS